MRAELLARCEAFLRDALGLSQKDVNALVAMAEESLGASLATLEDALAASDAARAEDAAHGLKGGLRNMGLADFAERAREMEDLAARGDIFACRERLTVLRSELGLAGETPAE